MLGELAVRGGELLQGCSWGQQVEPAAGRSTGGEWEHGPDCCCTSGYRATCIAQYTSVSMRAKLLWQKGVGWLVCCNSTGSGAKF